MSQYILIALVGLGCVWCAWHVLHAVVRVGRSRRVLVGGHGSKWGSKA